MAPHATYRNASNGSNDINEHAFVRDSGVDLPPPFPPQWQPKPFAIEKHSLDQTRRLRVIVIGAGLTGILAGILLPAKLDNLDLTILEKNADVGGTWYENTYPGVRCDIPSHVYQATFATNTQWTEEFATGAEILDYWQGLARRYDVYRYCKFKQRTTRLSWSDQTGKWTVQVEDFGGGQQYDEEADIVLTAIGRFNDWRMPQYPGMDDFQGPIRHTSAWDAKVPIEGKRIAIIGNGASGIQLVPALQPIAAHIDHYCRSKTYIARSWAGDIRKEGGQPFNADQLADWRNPEKYLAHRKTYEDKYWRGFPKIFRGSSGNEATREDAIKLMGERLKAAGKSELLETMIPDFSPNCRRPTPGPGYLEAICQSNVEYIQDPIECFRTTGIRTKDGKYREIDAAFCATGANTDLVPPFSIVSRGIDIRTTWRPGSDPGFPHTYMGIAAPGFPNMFFLYGPQAGGVAGTVPHVVENQIAVVAKLLRKIAGQGIRSMEPSKAATDDFAEYSETFYRDTVLTDNCRSWYKAGTNGRVHGLWPGSAAHLTMARRDPRWEDWKFSYYSRNRFAYLGNGSTGKEADAESDMTDYLRLPEDVDLRTLHE